MSDNIRSHWCWFAFHDWRCVHAKYFIDQSWDAESPSTFATFRCVNCGKVKSQLLYGVGYVSIAELNGADAHNESFS